MFNQCVARGGVSRIFEKRIDSPSARVRLIHQSLMRALDTRIIVGRLAHGGTSRYVDTVVFAYVNPGTSIRSSVVVERRCYRATPLSSDEGGRLRCPPAAFGEQIVCGSKAVHPDPWLTGRRTQQGQRRVAHLVAAVRTEGSLDGNAGGDGSRVVIPTPRRAELPRIDPQARRRVLFRVDGNRYQMHRIAGVSA